MLLAEEGLVAVVLTIDKKTGKLLTSPDIISRGFIYMRDNEEIMNAFRAELRRAVQQRFKRVDLDRFKAELKDHVTHYLFEQTQRSPIVIPVVNVIGGRSEKANNDLPQDRTAMARPEQPKLPRKSLWNSSAASPRCASACSTKTPASTSAGLCSSGTAPLT